MSIAVAAGLLTAPTASIAKDAPTQPEVLLPADNWYLEFAENKCRLVRTFGAEDNRHVLFFEQGGPEEVFGMTVAGPQIGKFRASRKTTVRFGTEQQERDRKPFFGTLGAFGTAIIYSTLRVVEKADSNGEDKGGDQPLRTELARLDAEAAAGIVQISFHQSNRVATLRTGDLQAPFEALNTCSHDLVRHWGLDLEKHRKVTQYPQWRNVKNISQRIGKRYPSSAWRRGQQGIIRMRVMIDAEGKVTECFIENATIADNLESPACREMQSAKFDPAIDLEGNPMASFSLTKIIYTLP